jgi:hypothetical protein
MRNVWIVPAVCIAALAAAPAAQARSLGTHTGRHIGTHRGQHHTVCPQNHAGVPLRDLANKYLGTGAPCGLSDGVIRPARRRPK